jgi:hypothetical protein
VDHATIQRWVFKFTPLVEQQFRKRKMFFSSNTKPAFIVNSLDFLAQKSNTDSISIFVNLNQTNYDGRSCFTFILLLLLYTRTTKSLVPKKDR